MVLEWFRSCGCGGESFMVTFESCSVLPRRDEGLVLIKPEESGKAG